jgi:Kef-type K+ transport system membrane component KefB
VLYLFLVGIEMDPKTMLQNSKKTSVIASFGIALPFALGYLLAQYL